MTRRRLIAALVVVSACAGGAPGPAAITFGQDACAHCRMAIVSQATAAQIVAPGEEPILFDELGCLRDHLKAASPARDAIVYVADHRTGAWIPARRAVFTQTSASTPMASGLLAHVDPASRDADPAAGGGAPVAADAVLGSLARSPRP